MMIGFVALVVANLCANLVRHGVLLSESWSDGLMGFFYGISFAALLLSVWLRRRTPGKPCA